MTPRIIEKNDIHILESKYIQTDFKTIVSNELDETTNEPKFKISKLSDT